LNKWKIKFLSDNALLFPPCHYL